MNNRKYSCKKNKKQKNSLSSVHWPCFVTNAMRNHLLPTNLLWELSENICNITTLFTECTTVKKMMVLQVSKWYYTGNTLLTHSVKKLVQPKIQNSVLFQYVWPLFSYSQKNGTNCKLNIKSKLTMYNINMLKRKKKAHWKSFLRYVVTQLLLKPWQQDSWLFRRPCDTRWSGAFSQNTVSLLSNRVSMRRTWRGCLCLLNQTSLEVIIMMTIRQ